MESNSLKHYGILGMRWGVRRTKAQLRRARGEPSRPRKVSKEEYEAAKKRAIDSGNTKTVQAWKGKLTNAELRQAIERCDLNKRLSSIDEGDKKSGLDMVESAMSTVGRVTNIINTGVNAYSAVAKINNTFNSKQLPVIDGQNYKAKIAKEAAKEEADRIRAEKTEQREAATAAQNAAKEAREAAKAKQEADREAATASKEAYDSSRKAYHESQQSKIITLIKNGKKDEVINNIDDYDSADVDAVLKKLQAEADRLKKLKDL